MSTPDGLTTPDGTPRRISYLAVPGEDAVTPDIVKLWGKAHANLGFTPNVFRAQALNPAQFSAWWAYFNLLLNKEGFLPPVEREMIAVVVSNVNRCVYCAVSHGAALRGLLSADGQSPDLEGVLAVNHRHAPLTARLHAMLDFAEKLTRTPEAMREQDLGPLRGHGLTDPQILELTQVIGMFNMTNRISSALGFVPNDEYHAAART
ncbi:peroxidase-related enzyme [Deinococcus aquiradiocola]|uniref:Alkyl hydroperoxide reductase AhpD n=1 Tax=Deinococcus aquiradiocola TaxID=393059 RepID=A0A917ULH5_9DEIO|nr:peroxidase-related enzyme [Deinococcus aquiradiocola]GGJ66249.1 alkyl hydroperoxide reductase AhpD [Deinococcus aquiradiocola]